MAVDLAELETSLNHLKEDAENGTRLYTEPPGDVELRTGELVANLRKRLENAVGYETPIPFAADLNVDRVTYTVAHEGYVYFPEPSAVPFVTTGVFDASQWRVLFRAHDLTRVEYINQNIPALVNSIRTSGYANRGDGGGGLHVRTDAVPGHSGYFRSLDGAYWLLEPEGIPDARQFGAVNDGATDCMTAIANALDAFNHVVISGGGTYAVSGMVTLGKTGQTVHVAGRTIVKRLSSHASTDPIFWLKAASCTVYGDGVGGQIETQKRCPRGIVRLGSADMNTVGANSSYGSVYALRIQGAVPGGQTSGDIDQGIAIYNPQLTGESSYDHRIYNLVFDQLNTAVGLHGYANTSHIWGLQLYRCGNATSNTYRKAIWFNGCQEVQMWGIFHHSSTDAFTVYVNAIDNTGVSGGKLHTPHHNRVRDLVCEQGGAAARAMYIESIGSHNIFDLGENVTLPVTIVPEDFGWLNTLIINGAYRTALRVGEVDRPLSARYVKRDETAGAATVRFNLYNTAPAVWKHGFVKITVSADNDGSSLSDAAWYLCQASANGNNYPTQFSIIDSGGNIATFTISMTGRVLEIASAKDNLVADVEYSTAAGNPGLT